MRGMMFGILGYIFSYIASSYNYLEPFLDAMAKYPWVGTLTELNRNWYNMRPLRYKRMCQPSTL